MKPDPIRANLYLPHIQRKLIAVSFVTIGEMLFGGAKKKWGPTKMAELHRRLQSVVMLPYDYKLCVTYGDLKAKLQEQGRPIADNDLWIAASSVRHSIPLISHNRSHFEIIPELVLISEAP
jgi:predicted nucleic acid-binding protein